METYGIKPNDQCRKFLEARNTLYVRIGGEAVIKALVDGMYEKIFEDAEVNQFYEKTNKEALKTSQVNFFTYLTGGTSVWEGKSMETAHQGRDIREIHFDRVALHTVVTLQELKITNEMINEFVALLLPLRSQIESR